MNNYSGEIQQRGYKKVGTVMSPLKWSCVAVETVFAVGLMQAPEQWMQIIFAILMVVTVLFFFSMYVFFAIKDPDRLQTEEYNLAHRSLNLREQAEQIKRGAQFGFADKFDIQGKVEATHTVGYAKTKD